MNLVIENLKSSFKSALIFFVGLSCLSCQSFQKKKQSIKTNSYVDKKIGSLQQKPLKSTVPTQKAYSIPIIDKNYFKVQADSAYLKGEEAFFKGDNTKALKYLKTALLFAPHSLHLQKRLAYIYEQEGLFAEALSHYQVLLKKTEQNKEFYQKLTDIYALKGLNKKAFEHHQHLLDHEPDNFSLWLKHALLLIHQEDWVGTLKALKKAKAKALSTEDKVQSLLSQAYVLAKLQNLPKSLKIIDQLNHLPIHEEELVLKVAEFYKSLQQDLLALSHLERFQQTQGVTPLVAKSLLDYYISFEHWEKALQQMNHIQALGQFEIQHYFYMAILLLEKRNYNRALVFLKDLVAKEPKNGQYLYLLAMAYEQKKEWLKALNTYSRVEISSPHFLTAQLQSAQLLKQLDQNKKAFSLLKKLSFPKQGGISPQALLLYAESFWNTGKKKKALKVLTKGLKEKPFHAELLFLRGFYLKQSGQEKLALKDMNQILKNHENHEEALNFIAAFYSEKQINLTAAEQMARKALSLNPHSGYFLNTLGWILFQKGNLVSALNYLSKAFVKNSKDSHIAKRLGTVHLELKNFEKSDYFFKEALKLEEND